MLTSDSWWKEMARGDDEIARIYLHRNDQLRKKGENYATVRLQENANGAAENVPTARKMTPLSHFNYSGVERWYDANGLQILKRKREKIGKQSIVVIQLSAMLVNSLVGISHYQHTFLQASRLYHQLHQTFPHCHHIPQTIQVILHQNFRLRNQVSVQHQFQP